MDNSSTLRDIIKMLTLAFGIILVIKTYYVNTEAFHIPKSNYVTEAQKQTKKKADTKKRRIIDKSFEDMMCQGDSHFNSSDYYEASRRYFDAKTIYPERFEPRIALCRSLMKLSEKTDYFLPSTQKEIHFAFNYSYTSNDERLLNELCQMDMDVINILEDAKTRFKYWDELMTIEDY